MGDVALVRGLQKDKLKNILNQLNGKKILVRGNHDCFSNETYYDLGFKYVANYIHIDEYFFCHFPLYLSRWTTKEEKVYKKIFDSLKCTTVYHGHIHNKNPDEWEPDGITRINTCVDFTQNNFKPIEITDIKIKEYISIFI